jgi:hypothetical protein
MSLIKQTNHYNQDYIIKSKYCLPFRFESKSCEVYSIKCYVIKSLSVMCDMSVDFSGYSGFSQQ